MKILITTNKITSQNKKHQQHRFFHCWLARVSGALLLACPARMVLADDYFNPAALEFSSAQQKAADLHYFSHEGGQQPGTYHVTVLLNDIPLYSRDVTFVQGRGGTLIPLLTVRELQGMGVNVRAFSALEHLPEGATIQQLSDFIPDAATNFDFSQQQLNISIPQVALTEKDRDYIDPSRWDEGVAAAFVNYTLAGSHSYNEGSRWNPVLLTLHSGANLGAWRLRNISSYRYDAMSHWQSQSTYLERDIKRLKSQFRVGDTYTPGEIFDSVQFRGVQMTSDDNMLPDSQRGFAPVIHGIAHSNAIVTVSQHGYVIYETAVAPGAFEIKDLYPTAQSGDLEITVRESDGSERQFTQPYSAIPFMLRQGNIKYSISAGRYHNSGNPALRSPEFIQSTLFWGLPMDFTAFGGVQVAQNYHSAASGLGKGLGNFGSIGVDVNWAKTDLPEGKQSTGQSIRAQYQKNFATTNTSFNIASYRYSSGGFYSFSEANNLIDPTSYVNNKRSRSEISVTQGTGDEGNLTISAYIQNYWRSGIQERTLHVGYYSTFKSASWGVGYFYTDSSASKKADRAISFNISVPFSALLPDSTVSYSMNSRNDGSVSRQVSLSGSALDEGNLYYSLQQGYDNKGNNANSSAAVDYHGSYGSASLGVSHDKHGSQFNYGLSGGVVAHAHGITLSQPLGDTFGIIRIPGAQDVAIESASDVRTDRRGYAIVPSLSPYHKNEVELDTETLPDNIDVELAGQTLIPTNGAVVIADYTTHIGNRILFTLSYRGATPPFGAVAQLERSKESTISGIVADKGQVYLSGMPSRGSLLLNWQENGVAKTCRAPYSLPEMTTVTPVKLVSAVCQ